MKFSYISFAVLLCLPLNAFGWGKDGHIIVAQLAEQGLTAKTKAALKELGFDHIGTDAVANYADKVRRNPEYPQYRSSGPWHFIDLPIQEIKTVDDVIKFTNEHPNNIASAIRRFELVLKDKAARKEDKQEALKFIVHFVGDIHQPLHCANNDDHGGNGVKVHFLGKGGKYLNLHHVWDTELVRIARGRRSNEELVSDWYNAKWFNQELVKKETKSMNALDWAFESYNAAFHCAYHVNGSSTSDFINKGTRPNLGEEYAKNGSKVVEDRLIAAGIRLAVILNKIFDPDGPGYNYSHQE